jgi:hypothetical protein
MNNNFQIELFQKLVIMKMELIKMDFFKKLYLIKQLYLYILRNLSKIETTNNF